MTTLDVRVQAAQQHLNHRLLSSASRSPAVQQSLLALADATIIGLTGTPIARTSQGEGTFKIFGTQDELGYLDIDEGGADNYLTGNNISGCGVTSYNNNNCNFEKYDGPALEDDCYTDARILNLG